MIHETLLEMICVGLRKDVVLLGRKLRCLRRTVKAGVRRRERGCVRAKGLIRLLLRGRSRVEGVHSP